MDRTDSAESEEKADGEAGSTPWYERAYDRFEQWNQDWNPMAMPDPDDPDGDGLSRSEEAEHGTFNFASDSDGDGISDGDEVAAGSDPVVDDADADPDGDGLTNAEEAEHGTRADQADTDGDGLLDGDEVKAGLSPTDIDTDGDLLTDDFELHESKTDPRLVDSEGDGVDDALRDPDGDGAPNLKEQIRGTDPLNAISDPASGKTDGGGSADDFLRENVVAARKTIAEADAEAAEVVEGVEDSRYLIVTDPADAAKASHSAMDSYIGSGFGRGGSGHVWNNRTEEVDDVNELPDGSTIAKGNNFIGARIEGQTNLTRDGDENDVRDLREAKTQDPDGGEVPLQDKGPPPAGEREPEGWDEGGEGEDVVEGVGDPTSMRIDPQVPSVQGANVSVIDRLNGGGERTAGMDLGGPTPAATPDDPSPLGKSVDPDAVAAERFQRGANPGSETEADPAASSSSDGTAGASAGARIDQGDFDSDDAGPAGTGDWDGGGEAPKETDRTENTEAEPDNENTAVEDNDTAGSSDPEPEPGVRNSINQYDPETDETTTYYYDEDGNVYDADGNLVPPDEVPDWVNEHADDPQSQQAEDGVSTSVDPDAGFGDRTKAEAIEDELGAPDGAPRGPVDPQRWEGTIEDRSLRHLITDSDLAQPVPDEVAAAGLEAPSVDANASGGRFGTGAIDWGPDHVTNETGPYEDEQVPEAVRSADGGDAAGEADTDALTPVQQGIALTAEPVDEPEPLQAIATDGREQGLAPQAPDDDAGDAYDESQWDEPADTVPPFPEVGDGGFDDGFGDRVGDFEPEAAPVEIDIEPDRFEDPAELF